MQKISVLFRIAVVISMIVISACSTITDEPSQTLTVIIEPQDKTISIGETTELSFNIKNVFDLFGISVEIAFDSTKINLPNDYFSLGNVWAEHQTITMVKKEGNRLNVCVVLESGSYSQVINGDCTLFRFSIKGLSIGESSLLIENITLINKEGSNIEGLEGLNILNSNIIIE